MNDIPSKFHIPLGRIWRALELADLLDASDIPSGSVTGMSDGQWRMLATAAGNRRAPSEATRGLVVDFLRNREAARSLLSRNLGIIPFPQERQ